MIPLGDSLARRGRPLITQLLSAVCVLVFVYELTLGGATLDAFVLRWGAVPRVVLAALSSDPRVPRQELLALFTSQFLHASLLHLGGNLVFLWVFGRAVEARLGSPLFLGFYLLVGALAGLVQCVVSANESEPLIGASGAIAGVLGMYFISYPGAWVRVLMPVLFFFWAFDLPAVLVLAFWFVSQFFSGISAITHASRVTGDVAVWAHVAGFALGAASAFLLPKPRPGAIPTARQPGLAGRRSDAPSAAKLISSVADLAALLLAARLVLRFFGLFGARSRLAPLAEPVLALTDPVVQPFHERLPDVRVLGGVLEIYTLAVIVLVYVLAGLLGQLLIKLGGQRKR